MQPTANIIARADIVKSAPWTDPADDVDAAGDLARRADPDPVAQAGADEAVVHQHQPLGQRHADVVLELLRRRAGAAFGAVDDDEVRRDPRRDDRLADRQELGAGADAQLEADGLAAGQPAQRRDELDEFGRRENALCDGGDTTVTPDRHTAGRRDLGD